MDFTPTIPPLPDEQAYARATMAVQNRMHRRNEKPVDHFLSLATAGPSIAKFSSAAELSSRSLEELNEERNDYADSTRSASTAVWLGTLSGLSVAREAHGSVIRPSQLFEYGPTIQIAINIEQGDYDRVLLRDEYIQAGEAGLRMLGRAAVTFISRWGVETVLQYQHRPLFEAAAGIVVSSAHAMHLNRFAQNYDWDAGLQGLTEQK